MNILKLFLWESQYDLTILLKDYKLIEGKNHICLAHPCVTSAQQGARLTAGTQMVFSK